VEFQFGELFPRVGFIVTNLETDSRAVVRFYNKRGTAEQWIKAGKQATHWTRLSCHRFRANEGTERCLWSRRHRRQLWVQAARAGQNGTSWGRLGAHKRENIAGMTRRGQVGVYSHEARKPKWKSWVKTLVSRDGSKRTKGPEVSPLFQKPYLTMSCGDDSLPGFALEFRHNPRGTNHIRY
jgi:hypothetical protein